MTRFPFIATVGVTAVVLATSLSVAQAADGDRPTFGMLDRDGSGEITRDELAAMGQARFEANDTNADGVLDKAELIAAASKRTEARVERMLTRLDANDDGVLSAEELADRRDPGRIFARLDSDGSGGVSEAEFNEGREKMRQRMRARASD